MSRASDRIKRRLAARALQVSHTAEERYVAGLRAVMAAVAREFEGVEAHEVDALTPRVLASLPRAVTPLFNRMAETSLAANAAAMKKLGLTARAVRHARGDAAEDIIAGKLGDAGLAPAIKAARDANIGLIEKAARAYASDVRDVLTDPANVGMRAEDLAKLLVERGRVSQSRAELIARDQTLKLNGNINRIRQQNAGITEYTWSTSHDDRVRDEHRILEGQTFSWANPPEPGHPGEDFQCRCVPIPVIGELDDVGTDTPDESTAEAPAEVDEFAELGDVVLGFEPAKPIAIPPSVVVAPPKPASTGNLAYLSDLDTVGLAAQGVKVDDDVSKVAAKVFDGRVPDAASWKKMYGPNVQVKEFGEDLGRLEVKGDVVLNGQVVGDVGQTFSRTKDGDLVVQHDAMFLREAAQGKGVGEAFSRESLRNYVEMGVDRVDVHAVDVGRYTWSRFGYSWPEADGKAWAGRLESFLDGKVTKEQAKVLSGLAHEGAHAVAALEVDGRKLGKDFLLAKDTPDWHGSLRLKAGDAGFEVAKRRLKL